LELIDVLVLLTNGLTAFFGVGGILATLKALRDIILGRRLFQIS
jgi:hypothetical protein